MLLFSYGALQQESVQRATFGWRLPGVADALPGYARTRLEITDPDGLAASGERFPPIVSASADPDAAVAGTLPARTAAELGAADRHEAVACRRVACTLRSGRQAWVGSTCTPEPSATPPCGSARVSPAGPLATPRRLGTLRPCPRP